MKFPRQGNTCRAKGLFTYTNRPTLQILLKKLGPLQEGSYQGGPYISIVLYLVYSLSKTPYGPYMGGCQNYGPQNLKLGPLNTRCCIILRSQRGTIILTTSHVSQTPQCTSTKGLMVSIRWYLGFLQGQLGGDGYGYGPSPSLKAGLLGSRGLLGAGWCLPAASERADACRWSLGSLAVLLLLM